MCWKSRKTTSTDPARRRSKEAAERERSEFGRKRLLFRSFERLMEQERLFLDPDLKMKDVVRALGTNRTYLSQALHQSGYTFREYVCRKRLGELYGLIRDKERMRQLERQNRDAYAVAGFSSRRSADYYLLQDEGVTYARLLRGERGTKRKKPDPDGPPEPQLSGEVRLPEEE